MTAEEAERVSACMTDSDDALHELCLDYSIMRRIGKGSYSEVYLVSEKSTEKRFAAKVIPIHQSGFNPDEAELLLSLNHPNVVKAFRVLRGRNSLVIVMEYLSGGELFQVAQGSPVVGEAVAALYLYQVLQALDYLHCQGVVHRDVKLENMLLQDGGHTLKLIDFGFSKVVGKEKALTSCCGSPNYMSPEMLRATRNESSGLPLKKWRYGTEVDMWSAGVAMFVLLVGQYPFYDERRIKWHRSIITGEYTIPSTCAISQEARDLLSHLLDVNSESRYTARQALSHSWFAKMGCAATSAGEEPASNVAVVAEASCFATPPRRKTPPGSVAVAAAAVPFTPPPNNHKLQFATPLKEPLPYLQDPEE